MLNRVRSVWVKAKYYRKGKALLKAQSTEDQQLIADIRAKKLTYLSDRKLAGLVATMREIEQKNLPGLCLEAGCALGGSSILLAKLKRTDRQLNVYDVFGMIPPPTAEDPQDVHDRYATIAGGKSKGIKGDKYYGYEENLYETVKQNLKSFDVDPDTQNVALIKGLLQDTMKIDGPVAFAHVDVDWYDPVITCLQRVFPNLVVGGSIILDDYHVWGGCRSATDAYLKEVSGQYALDSRAGSLRITRTR